MDTKRVLAFPHAGLSAQQIVQLASWTCSLHKVRRLTSQILPNTWQVMHDSDGSILLLPPGEPEPGFAITPMAGEYEVLVCDPEDMDELGPFETLSDALSGITHWLTLPARMLS